MLESDVNNPDRALHVEFYRRAVIREGLSEKEGRPIFEDEDWIRITPPGSMMLLQVERKAFESDKRRFPQHWSAYQQFSGESREIGTPISSWPILTPALAENLRAGGFHTVEQLAGASDQQLEGLHMAAGMTPNVLRGKAQAFLAQAHDTALAQKQEAELVELRKQISELRAATGKDPKFVPQQRAK
jgi:hypothetical protein